MRAVAALLVLAACKKEEEPDPPAADDDDDDSEPPECAEDGECARNNICDDGACVAGDRDNTFDEATPLPLGEELAIEGVINPAGDVDNYVYESPGQEWVSIRTVVEGEELDTVVTLFDADGNAIASMDDYPVFPYLVTGYDSVLYAYLPEAGSWYVSVQDRRSFFGIASDGGRDFEYSVLVRPANGSSEPDSATSPSISVDLVDGSTITVFGMVIGEPGDVDYGTLTFPFEDRLLEVWGQPGVAGSSANALVRLKDQTGAVVAEKTSLDAGELGQDGVEDVEWLSWFRAAPGTYLLEGTDLAGAGAADAWFPLFVRTYEVGDSHPFFGTSVYEREVEPNDQPAEALALTRITEGTAPDEYGAHRLDGEIGSPGDSDFYSVVATEAGAITSVRCWTDRFGSLALLDVELYSQGVMFASGTTADPNDYYVSDATVPSAGPMLVRVVGNGGESGPGHWYRCGVYIRP